MTSVASDESEALPPAAAPARVSLALVESWASEALRRSGLSAGDADATAACLAFADARGVHTHGFMRLQTYVRRVRAGGINPVGRPSAVRDLGALVIVDADNAIGASAGIFSTDIAIARAREHGIGCAIARNANHFGVAAFYGNRIADAGMLGIVACNTDKVMCAPAGGKAVLGTNPLAITIPLPADRRPQLDMATTQVSQGRLIMASHSGESIPAGWAVDSDGRPTNSPADGLRGALLPAGGPKGFGLAFAIDAIVALSGAATSNEVNALYGDPAQAQGLGQMFIAMRADAALSLDEYERRIRSLVGAIHSSGTEGSGQKPLAPGEPELARVGQNSGSLTLTNILAESFAEVATATGLPLLDEIRRASPMPSLQ
jgi:LDH2 family malate/lactate/ureidoglycolate dehydrogenase